MKCGTLLIVFLAFVAAACDGSRADGKSPIVDVRPHRLCLVLDPTVQEPEWAHRVIDSLINRMGEGTHAIVWMVRTGAVAGAAPTLFEFPFDPHRRLSDVSEAAKKAKAEIWNTFQQHGKAASAASRVPQSCVLTSLYQLSQYLRERDDAAKVDTDLVVASDLLEACSEWGTAINLERTLLQETTVLTPEVRKAVSLRTVKTTTLIRAPHRSVDTPGEAEHIRALWENGLRELGAGEPRVVTDIDAVSLFRETPR
jgi:hypothetical protein